MKTYEKRHFDCGHYAHCPGYFAPFPDCPVCHNGELERVEPTDEPPDY